MIPDAPYIRMAETFGTDYTASWYGLEAGTYEDDEEDDE